MRNSKLQILGFPKIDKARISNHKFISTVTKKELKTFGFSKNHRYQLQSFRIQNTKLSSSECPKVRFLKREIKQDIIRKVAQKQNKST